jgi:hypothetical protein
VESTKSRSRYIRCLIRDLKRKPYRCDSLCRPFPRDTDLAFTVDRADVQNGPAMSVLHCNDTTYGYTYLITSQ